MTAPRTDERAASTLVALSTELADAVEHVGRSTVAIHARRRIPSSGIVWRSGVVVAASHTIRRDEDISLTLPDGNTVPVTLAGRDPGTDIAVLRLPDAATSAIAATLAPDDALRVGALIVAVGRPGDSITASLGAISAIGGRWRTWREDEWIDSFGSTSPIYDGFSGGPLADAAVASSASIPLASHARHRSRFRLRPSPRGGRAPRERPLRRGYAGVAVQPVAVPERLVREHGLPAETRSRRLRRTGRASGSPGILSATC